MHIVTFTRSTPDTAIAVLATDDGGVTWGDAATVVNPWDDYALEETIRQAKTHKGNSTVIAIGPQMHEKALRQALAMGIKNAIRVEDAALNPHDSRQWATLAAGAVAHLDEQPNLVLFGKSHIDVDSDQVTFQTAHKLGWPLITNVSQILELDNGRIRVQRRTDQAVQIVRASLPVVISVLKGINEPRFPAFIAIRKANKTSIPVYDAAALGVELPASQIEHLGYHNLPERSGGGEIIEGATVQEKVATLVQKLKEEKIL